MKNMITDSSIGWSRLDNAAKIFPPASSKKDTKVFRFSCELFEAVDEILLQKAVEAALSEFPFYRSILKQGFFWHYFEQSDLEPVVYEESDPPCSQLYNLDSRNLLFQVTYFKCRINLEIYHALTDGTGALQFLKTIVSLYLQLAHAQGLSGEPINMDYDASVSQREEDSFEKYYTDVEEEKKQRVTAYQVHSSLLPEGRMRILEGICSVKDILRLAHDNNTTMTIYLTAALLCAIAQDMPMHEIKKPVVLSVPVNLRNYFNSETARNFFSVINISYRFTGTIDMADVITSVRKSFEAELTKPKLSAHLNKLIAFEKNPFIRIVPLPIKRLSLKIVHDRARKEVTGTISNVGKVTMPAEISQYINRFDVFVTTTRVQTCICSYGDKLAISFTSPFTSTDVYKNFFRILTSGGAAVEIVSNNI